MASPVTVTSLKSCEDQFNSLVTCMSAASDLNGCRGGWAALQSCAALAPVSAQDDGEHKDETSRSLSSALQAALPRVFKNTEDLPRERTILADTLAKVAPHIFDPKDDDDDDKDDK